MAAKGTPKAAAKGGKYVAKWPIHGFPKPESQLSEGEIITVDDSDQLEELLDSGALAAVEEKAVKPVEPAAS